MKIILNMPHARCLFAQRVYAAQLASRVPRKARPFSPAAITRIFKAIPILEGDNCGYKGQHWSGGFCWYSARRNRTRKVGLCFVEVRWCQGCHCDLCWRRGGRATILVPRSPSCHTSKEETEAAFSSLRRVDSLAREGAWTQAQGQKCGGTIPSPSPLVPMVGRLPRLVAWCHALFAPSAGCCPWGRPARPPARAVGHVVLR